MIKIKITPKKIILSSVIAVLIAVAVVGSVFANNYWDFLMGTFGTSNSTISSEVVNKAAVLGDDLVQEMA